MKVCICRDFDCAATRKAIEENKPEKAEDVHRKVAGEDPKCGACLALVDEMIQRFNKEGKVPGTLEISRKDQEAAERRLGERFAKEEAANDEEFTPAWKRRYIRKLDCA